MRALRAGVNINSKRTEMKKIFRLIVMVYVLMTAVSVTQVSAKDVPQSQLIQLINSYRSAEGVEVVSVGSLGTSAFKAVIKASLAGEDDPEVRELLKIIRSIRKIAVVDFEDCAADVRDAFNRDIQRVLASSELLLEVKDDGESLSMYGVVNEKAGVLKDFVLYSAEDCALICLFGSIPLSAIMSLAE